MTHLKASLVRRTLRFRGEVPLLRIALVATLVLSGRSALAWDREMHTSIVDAALALSPAAEARLPLEFRDAFYRELREADALDKDCRYHPSSTGDRDAAAQAEKAYLELTNPGRVLKPYARAQVIGRYLHYVADAVVPTALKGENVPNRLPNFFENRNLLLFRERQELAAPIARALRARAVGVSWGSNEQAASSMIYRLVVNVTADALMLLPLRSPGEKVDEGSPVIFIVNRMDNGLAAKKTSGSVGHTTTRMSDIGGPYQWYTYGGGSNITSGSTTTTSWSYESHGGGESSKKSNLMEQPGVQIAEMNVRQTDRGSTIRALLFNNSEHCASDVVLKMGTWKWVMPERMPARALRMVEVDLPKDLNERKLTSSYKTEQCAGALETGNFLSSDRRLVIGNTGAAPRFQGVAVEVNLSQPRGTSKALIQ